MIAPTADALDRMGFAGIAAVHLWTCPGFGLLWLKSSLHMYCFGILPAHVKVSACGQPTLLSCFLHWQVLPAVRKAAPQQHRQPPQPPLTASNMRTRTILNRNQQLSQPLLLMLPNMITPPLTLNMTMKWRWDMVPVWAWDEAWVWGEVWAWDLVAAWGRVVLERRAECNPI